MRFPTSLLIVAALSLSTGKADQQGIGGGAHTFAARWNGPAGASTATAARVEVVDPPAIVDLGALGVRPGNENRSLANAEAVPFSAAIGTGRAFLNTTHGIVNQNTPNAFGIVSSNWRGSEIVAVSVNGVVSSFQADYRGSLGLSFNTGPGFGSLLIEAVGQFSHRRAAGVVQVAPTGPYLPGVAASPHAVRNNGFINVNLLGEGYPPNTTVNIYRNGVMLTSVSTGAFGFFYVGIDPASTEDTAVIYSADVTAAPATMAGVSVEERDDAGYPNNVALVDVNSTRAIVDRPVLDAATGGTVALMGEGFIASETVAISGCATGTAVADFNGALAAFLTFGPGSGVAICTLIGGTSSRIAWAAVLAHSGAANVRTAIVAPSNSGSGGTITVVGDRLPPNDPTAVYIDGVQTTTATTDNEGRLAVAVPKPSTGSGHVIAVAGSAGAQASVLLLRRGTRDDVDRDVQTDRTVYRPSTGVWYSALRGGAATATMWGADTDIDVLGDYDGDDEFDVAVWRPSAGG